ncbi:thioesterase [Streptomyces sp. F-3]|jgi:pimeloyl-ACP methyl ester carboxylesterase|uniref:Alpha/beta hydrolase n=1 Tax=Streptomyces thermogriseus TaxID=75292 RepID=A0ABN1T5B8_9ACTN|nr:MULTISPECIES: alpha/beta hydrolase [Streptomyces]MDN5383427.1 alpha/beta fold hydrolase [Streptomyces sp. LB8]GAT84621.1 thioesterase [Streptomyces sp. F-3]
MTVTTPALTPGTLSPGVRRITLDAAGLTLSALLAQPAHGAPRATVVALHGGGMSAGYFDGRAHPGQSLLRLGARLGYTVLAPDRPGYGASADALPEGQCLAEQADSLHAALDDFVRRHDTGAGLFLLAHSYGGKLALAAAARDDGRVPRDAGRGLLGLDISGLGHRYAVLPEELPNERGHGHWTRTWGKLRLYPPGTFRGSGALVAPMPVREREEALRWPETFASLAARVRVPVRLTFAEHEAWWRHDDDTLAALREEFGGAPRVVVDRLPGAGHNISLGWAARSYHLRALGFLEECLALRECASAGH